MEKRERKAYSKKKTNFILFVGGFGLVLGFASLIIGAILQENEVSSIVYLPLCLACFPIWIGSAIFLIYHQPGMILRDIEKQLNTAKETGLDVLENIEYDIDLYCTQNKFDLLEEGYYQKRKFNINKDYINYYIKKVISIDVNSTIQNEFAKFNNYEFKRNNKCFILFVEKNEINDKDLECLLKISNVMISNEIVPNITNNTAIIVLVDIEKKIAYLSLPGRNKLSFYNIGYKTVKEIFANK